jgi:hypothetical protein
MIGAGEAWSSGVEPFLIGAAVKTAGAVAIIKLVERLLRRPSSAEAT